MKRQQTLNNQARQLSEIGLGDILTDHTLGIEKRAIDGNRIPHNIYIGISIRVVHGDDDVLKLGIQYIGFAFQGLFEQGVIEQIYLVHRKVIGGAPVGVNLAQLFRVQSLAGNCPSLYHAASCWLNQRTFNI